MEDDLNFLKMEDASIFWGKGRRHHFFKWKTISILFNGRRSQFFNNRGNRGKSNQTGTYPGLHKVLGYCTQVEH